MLCYTYRELLDPYQLPAAHVHRSTPAMNGILWSQLRGMTLGRSVGMSRRVWNTKRTKAHEMHEKEPCQQADFRVFRDLSQLSWSKLPPPRREHATPRCAEEQPPIPMEIATGHEVGCFLYSWEKVRKETPA